MIEWRHERLQAHAGVDQGGGVGVPQPSRRWPSRRCVHALTAAQADLADANKTSRSTPSHLPLGQVRPGSRLLETERKLLTHAIRMSAYNSESALARLLRPYYSRSEREGRALLRAAFTLTGDLQIIGTELHVRLDPASAPRRSKALAALCTDHLTRTLARLRAAVESTGRHLCPPGGLTSSQRRVRVLP